MDATTPYLLLALVVGIFAVYAWNQRREIRDGKALFWATVSEPLHYVSDDPDDEAVTMRAKAAREKLIAHGNRYLKPDADVWEYVYSATPETPTRDFSMWQDWAQQDVLKRRDAWRQQKAQWNADAAKQHFGGQTINTQPSAN